MLIGFRPADSAVLDDLLEGEDRGLPVGPYLSGAGVSRRRYEMTYATPDALDKSLHQVRGRLEAFGLAWLQRLRDRAFYAAEVDPDALLDAALAYEPIGDLARARKTYDMMMDRFRQMFAFADESLVMKQMGRRFTFVAEKLGVEAERVGKFRPFLEYSRPVRRLDDAP